MATIFSTGSQELDALLEEVQAGDNLVFYTSDPQDYVPFVDTLLDHVERSLAGVVYIRAHGLLDELVARVTTHYIVDLEQLLHVDDPLVALENTLLEIGPQPYYVFEPLHSLKPWFEGEEQLKELFLTLCPLLYRLESVAYWALTRGSYSSATIAAIRDCTQVFCRLDRVGGELLITPLKVWGRYSEAMFRPHRVSIDGGIHIRPLPVGAEYQQSYTEALAEKNRELAEIRDALSRSNRALQERNQELAALNERLAEQSRLYQSLRTNLDHLLAVFEAGQDIGSSLVVDQVHSAIIKATQRLFDVKACRLHAAGGCISEPIDVYDGLSPDSPRLNHDTVAALRTAIQEDQKVRSARLAGGFQGPLGSVAIAPVVIRGTCLGTLEVYADDARLDNEESRTLLSFLSSEASIALDNAYLYRETELQGEQLRSFVEEVIIGEEQESRRLAFDLHDGLVQLIVASYQHLQTSQAWRGRDPKIEEQEIGQGVRILRQAIYEARRLIGQLRPAGLDDFGLVHALQLYIAQLASESEWQISLEVDPQWPKLSSALEAAIFRIVQEATTNARKYAAAPRVRVQLSAHREHLEVSVRDWGKGFDPAAISAAVDRETDLIGHLGLVGIRERARMWGGRCEIASQPGQGTTITVYIPRSHTPAESSEMTGDREQ